jgi:uncharacterized protein YjdB
MKIGKQRAFSPWVIAATVTILIAGFVFTGCDDGNTPQTVVPEVVVTSVTLDKDEFGLVIGDDYTLTATVLPESAVNKTLTWKSSRTVVATVDQNGKVTAKAYGDTIITATAKSGKMAICVVTVGDVVTTGITLQPALTMEVEEKSRLFPVVEPPNAVNKNVDWSSDNIAVATVAANGTVTAVAAGTATITATTHNGGFEASCIVTVNNISVKGITLNKDELFLEDGDEETLIATVLPVKAFNKAVTWESSDPEVATVDSAGKVRGVADGEATITVTTVDGGFEESCTVIVAYIPIESISLDDTYLAVGGKKTLTLTIEPDYIKNKTATWEIDDETVATIDENGIITGVGEGEATITAISNKDPTQTATCTVTVDEGMLQWMVKINAGTFTMGSPETEPQRINVEIEHEVTLTQSFYMFETPVLIMDYAAVTGDSPYTFSWMIWDCMDLFGDDEAWLCPAEGITWYDAVEFCNKLSELEGFEPVYTITNRQPATGLPITGATVTCDWTANGYRLPTEAEWEYACRAGTRGPFHTGDNIISPSGVSYDGWYVVGVDDFGEANYDGNYPYNDNDEGEWIEMTAIPYLYEPNDWGLYTMHGNVEELCWDWLGAYSSGAQTDPRGPATGDYRIARGGSWYDEGRHIRSAMRNGYEPNIEMFGYAGAWNVGFRFVRNAPNGPDPKAMIGRSGTAKRERVLPQGFLQGKPLGKPQGKKTFDKNSASPDKLEFLRKKGVEE